MSRVVDDYGPVLENPEKLAPNSPEAEEAVLGSILINPDALFDVAAFLQSTDFFIVRNAWIWDALLTINERGDAIDNLTLIQELRVRNQLDQVGGAAYITKLINNTPTHIHAETYGRIVSNAAIRRRLMAAAAAIAQTAMEENAEIEQVVNEVTATLEAVTLRSTKAELATGQQVVEASMQDYLAWIGDPREVRGLATGIVPLDRIMGGMEEGGIYTIFGPTKSGKSTLAAWVALNLAEQVPILVVSTEMDSKFWLTRVVSDLSGIPYAKLKSGQLDSMEKDTVAAIYGRLYRISHHITMLQTATPSPAQIKANVAALHRRGQCEVVLIDSVQNVVTPGVTEIFPRVTLAADLGIQLSRTGVRVLQTSQTGRNAKNRPDKESGPELTDAAGSQAVENNSWMVLGMHRMGYYKPDPVDIDYRVKLRILGGRTVPLGHTVYMRFAPGIGYVGMSLREWNDETIRRQQLAQLRSLQRTGDRSGAASGREPEIEEEG